MSSDHQDTRSPSTAGELHRQLPPSIAGNNFISLTKSLPQTPSPMTPTNVNSVLTNSTPGSNLSAAFASSFFNIPPTSFQDATINTLLRTLSDADSSANQTTTTTPPMVPRNNPLRRSVSDTVTVDYEQTQKTNNSRIRRSPSDTSDYQQPRKVSSSPQSYAGKQTPKSTERLRKMQDMVTEIERRCLEIMSEVEEDTNPPQTHELQEQDESVGVERLTNGDLRFELSCSCGKNFEMLIKHNGYCFYRLT